MLGLLLSLGAMACTSRKGLVSRPPSDAGVDSREDSERSPEVDSADLAWSHDFGIDVESRAIDAQAQVEAGPPVCGNGIIEPGEMCDDGTDKNVGAYGGCTSDCNYAPNCGDGIKIPSEECDDGILDGTYGGCTKECKFAPYCGDGVLDLGWEQCDDGIANGREGYCPSTCNMVRPPPGP